MKEQESFPQIRFVEFYSQQAEDRAVELRGWGYLCRVVKRTVSALGVSTTMYVVVVIGNRERSSQ